MATVLFWNLGKNPATFPHLRCLAAAHAPDVFLLAEAPEDLAPALSDLNASGQARYREPGYPAPKVRVLTRYSGRTFCARFTGSGGHMTVWALKAPGLAAGEVLLAVVHLPSKAGGRTPTSQASTAITVAAELAEYEDRRGHRNTVVVGDFNMNPFDPGMTLVTGLHGLMTRRLAELPDRLHEEARYRRLYNPMWGLFGDQTPGPAGTYYWRSSEIENPHWSMLDQVLVRSDVVDRLQRVEIVGHDGVHDLAGPDGHPDRRHLSDHLPLLFALDV